MNKNIEPSPSAINETHRYLINQGALDVHPDFSVASNGQFDVVFDNRRYLLTANNSALATHQAVLEQSDQERLEVSEYLSYLNPRVAAMEIPRDARTLTQVAVSTDSKFTTNALVYGKLGEVLASIKKVAGVLPTPESLDLSRVLYSRVQDIILLVPPMQFEPHTEKLDTDIIRSIEQFLEPAYRSFGASAMVGAFKGNMHND